MTCKNLEGLITEYLEEALAPPARADFEAHLAACPDCQKRFDETRALIAASHDLGGKINQDWRARAGETEDQFMENLQARALKESSAERKRYPKLAPAAAAVVVIAIAAGVWFHVQTARRAAQPQNLTIDLSHWMLFRGAGQPQQPAKTLKRALLSLTILQPVGTLPGKYQVEVRKNGRVLAHGLATAKFMNGLTALHLRLDCSHLKEGDYILAIRKDDWQEWEEYPVVVR
ncbi:MAG TPA: zf-HC2 domain-containing protein [Terriglobia bacterium]|nr:zf-HC2 domain-containing protein [Terriglobia bacterium]